MRSKQTMRLLSFLAALTLIAAACGTTTDTTEAAPGTEAPATTEAGTTETTAAPGTTVAAGPDGYCADSAEGELIWAHEQEPGDLHLDDPNNNLSVTSWILQPIWEGLTGDSTNVEFIPELLTEIPTVSDNGDGTFSATFTLRDGLMWSDGEPITADDVVFTWQAIMAEGPLTDADGNPVDADEDGNQDTGLIYLIGDRTGYDTITGIDVASDTEFTITWSAFFAGWPALFSRVFPAHEFSSDPAEAAAQLNESLRDWVAPDGDILPSSGPMIFVSYEPGVSLKMVRNDNYHGSISPDAQNRGVACVTGLTINFVPDTDAQINSLKAGEAHFIHAQPQLQYEELAQDDGFTVAVKPGPIYEHWGLNLLNTHLSDPLVREAVAYAFDKQQVVEVLYAPLFGDALAPEGLWNTYFMPNQSSYEPHGLQYAGNNVADAEAKLTEAGYTKGDDGIFTHPDKGRLSLRVGTTGGNALRELQQQILQQQFAAAGIEIVIDNVDGSAYFGERPFSAEALACSTSGGAEGDCTIWDITQFAWVGGPWPGGQSGAYRSDSGFMPYGHVNEDFNAKADECDATLDDAARNACYNELDLAVTTLEGISGDQGLFMLPITQKPDFYAYNNQLLSGAGLSPDTNTGGPLANIVDFKLAP